MNCPRCQEICRIETYEDVEIDRCSACQGIWLDYEEIVTILKERQVKFSDEDMEAMKARISDNMPEVEEQHQLPCPKCSINMRTVNYQANTGVIIDRCPKNCGLWFDPNELEAVQANAEYWEDQSQKQMTKWKQLYKDEHHIPYKDMYPGTKNPLKMAINAFYREKE